jgi:hypothetical protein
MFYIALLLVIATYFKSNQNKILILNAKWLLVLIIGFSVVHKFLSDEYMSGEFFGYYFYTGQFLELPLNLWPEIQAISKKNVLEISKISKIHQEIILRPPFKYIEEISIGFAYLTIAVEVAIVGLLFSNLKTLKNVLFTLFLVLNILLTGETGFVSMLCVLLIMQLGNERSIFRLIYLLIFILSMSLIISKKGLF